MCASRGTMELRRARLPAVVCILSAVAMFWVVVLVGEGERGTGGAGGRTSLTRTGTPCMGPRGWPCSRSASRAVAMARASGFTSMTEPR